MYEELYVFVFQLAIHAYREKSKMAMYVCSFRKKDTSSTGSILLNKDGRGENRWQWEYT